MRDILYSYQLCGNFHQVFPFDSNFCVKAPLQEQLGPRAQYTTVYRYRGKSAHLKYSATVKCINIEAHKQITKQKSPNAEIRTSSYLSIHSIRTYFCMHLTMQVCIGLHFIISLPVSCVCSRYFVVKIYLFTSTWSKRVLRLALQF